MAATDPNLEPTYQACRRTLAGYEDLQEYLHIDFSTVSVAQYPRAYRRFLSFQALSLPTPDFTDSSSDDENNLPGAQAILPVLLSRPGPPVAPVLIAQPVAPPGDQLLNQAVADAPAICICP